MATKQNASGGAWGASKGNNGGNNKGPPASVLQAAARAGVTATPSRSSGGSNNNNNNKNNRNYKKQNSSANGGGGKGGGGGGKGGGGGGSNKKNNNSGNNASLRIPSKRPEEVEMLDSTGTGATEPEKAVVRVSTSKFLSCRLQYLQAPVTNGASSDDKGGATIEWTPHEKCHWKDNKDRIDGVQAEQMKMWNFKALDVNNETRWKAKVMVESDTNGANGGTQVVVSKEEADAEQLRQAVAILNKLSWTTLHKLTLLFLETIGATAPTATADQGGNKPAAAVLSKEVVNKCMVLIVDKAMGEPHFAELYARFSAKLATVHKTFKKTLLAICQEQFEETDKELTFAPDASEAERKYALKQSKQKSIGLMQFIGELYKNKLIKGAIMIGCLQRLLVNDDDEKLECFAKLMTTIGERLHDNEDEPEMIAVWEQVYALAGKTKKEGMVAAGSRIKFLLTDLIELRDNGWVTRRVEEKAMSIAQIHKQVAREEKMGQSGQQQRPGKPPSNKIKRSQSGSAISNKPAPPPVADSDGFVEVQVAKPKKQTLRRAQSDGVTAVTSSLQRAMIGGGGALPNASEQSTIPQAPISEYMDPKECAQKMKSILKEFFIGGDTDDAVLSIDELVGAGHAGDVERGAAMIEGGALLVLEMKDVEVRKFLAVVSKCLKEDKMKKESIPLGLSVPLECLRDVEIDAPLASALLASVIAEWIQLNMVSVDFLLKAPEYFRVDGRPADFAVQILSKRGGDVTDADVQVVTSLMSDDDKTAHPSVKDWLEAEVKK